jgi:SAM-dependent methyltransferase
LSNNLRNWKLKARVQGVLGSVPFGSRLNDALQEQLGGLRNFDANVSGKVGDWLGIAGYLAEAGSPDFGRFDRVLEIGSGWYPVLPLCMALSGVKRVDTVDLVPHLSARLTRRAVAALKPHLPVISERGRRALSEVSAMHARLSTCDDVDSLLQVAGVSYRAPADATRLSEVADGTYDLVYSNSVLEHVAPDILPRMLGESRRVLRDGGLMVHAVACNDHYAHFDRSVSFVNYLQFSEAEWRRWNPSFHFQNRLRASDFLGLARDAGFEVVHVARTVRPGTREALASMRVAPCFGHYELEDLVTTSVDFVARKR